MEVVWELVRMAPSQREGERIPLETAKGAYRVGRSVDCDIRLFSPTASREHAQLRRDECGRWLLERSPGREVLADGEPIEGSCELCEGLSLVMGSDRLVCRSPAADEARLASPEPAAASTLGPVWALGALAALAMVLTVFILWRSSGA